MIISWDFVTNSSSTSFIVVSPASSITIQSLVEAVNRYIKEYNSKNSWKDDFEPAPLLDQESVRELKDGSLAIEDYIPFYGDPEDMPEYLRNLDLSAYGIEGAKILVRDKNRPDSKEG
jgi:hypothetical protein